MLALAATPAAAKPGDLDPQFGNAGIAQLGGSDLEFSENRDVAVAPDGKIVIAGGLAGPLGAYAFVLRLLPNGAPDPSFSDDGLLLTLLGNNSALATSVLVQPDGKVVIAGYVTAGGTNSPFIARITDAGQIDTGFAPASPFPGAVFATFVTDDSEFSAVARLTDGRIIASGTRFGSPRTWFTMRVTGSGILDTTFNSPSGYAQEGFLTYDATALAMVLRTDDRSVVCGQGAHDAVDQYSMGFKARTVGGAPDPAFGGGTGAAVPVLLPGLTYDSCRAIALQPDGKFVAAGSTSDGGSSSRSILTRLNEDGSVDSSFANNGTLHEQRGDPVSFANDVVVEPGGRVIAVGRSRYDAVGHFAVWGYQPNGAPDPSFGDNGYAGRAIGEGWAESVALSGDRAIVVGHANQSVTAFAVKLREDPVALPAARAVITSPSKSRIKRAKLKKIAGTATASGAAVAKVEVAVLKVGKRKSKRCAWLSSTKAKFRSVRKPRAGCTAQRWIAAKGTAKWSLALKKKLPRGKYKLYARATAVGGLPETSFTRALRNYRALTLTR